MTGSRRIGDEMAAIFGKDPDEEPPVRVATCAVCRRELVAKEATYQKIGDRWYTLHRACAAERQP